MRWANATSQRELECFLRMAGVLRRIKLDLPCLWCLQGDYGRSIFREFTTKSDRFRYCSVICW